MAVVVQKRHLAYNMIHNSRKPSRVKSERCSVSIGKAQDGRQVQRQTSATYSYIRSSTELSSQRLHYPVQHNRPSTTCTTSTQP